MWPFMRIGAMLSMVPVLGSQLVTMRIRLMLAVMLAVMVAPLTSNVPQVDPLGFQGLIIGGHQILIGLAMGFTMRMVFAAFVHGGQIIAMQMGLGFASMIDPQNGVQVPVVSQFYLILTTLIFLAVNGHMIVIEVLVNSFRTLPISTEGMSVNGLWTLVSWGSQMFSWAVVIALPAVTALLVANLAFGVVTRAAPQLNIFAVGFPMTMTLGFVVILATLGGIVHQFNSILGEGLSLARFLAVPGVN